MDSNMCDLENSWYVTLKPSCHRCMSVVLRAEQGGEEETCAKAWSPCQATPVRATGHLSAVRPCCAEQDTWAEVLKNQTKSTWLGKGCLVSFLLRFIRLMYKIACWTSARCLLHPRGSTATSYEKQSPPGRTLIICHVVSPWVVTLPEWVRSLGFPRRLVFQFTAFDRFAPLLSVFWLAADLCGFKWDKCFLFLAFFAYHDQSKQKKCPKKTKKKTSSLIPFGLSNVFSLITSFNELRIKRVTRKQSVYSTCRL